MPPKRKSDDVELDDAQQQFRKRGDLQLYHFGTKADVALTVREECILLHKSFLISRVGFFKQRLGGHQNVPVDRTGRAQIAIDSHDAKSVRLVVEFIYGDWMVEIMEYPSEKQPIIQDCILLYNLGHDFDIPKMITYATKHLGMYLSRKLKEFCIYPVAKALVAVAPREFINDLEVGIQKAENAHPADGKDHPRSMLIDFVVVGRDTLFRDAGFRFNIDEDVLPNAFVKDVLLAQFGTKYQTQWMTKLRPEDSMNATKKKKRGDCAGCGEVVAMDQKAVYNPFSQPSLARRYTQVCCEDCAREMDKGDGAGVQWHIFNDVKKE